MVYEVITVDLASFRAGRAWKYGQLDRLQIGQGIHIPLHDLSYKTGDPTRAVRSSASAAGKRLGKKFGCRATGEGVLIVRFA